MEVTSFKIVHLLLLGNNSNYKLLAVYMKYLDGHKKVDMGLRPIAGFLVFYFELPSYENIILTIVRFDPATFDLNYATVIQIQKHFNFRAEL